jgi:hypothetical protein
MEFLDPAERVRCPCCGYPTLGERAAYEICPLCWWEDDGQGDAEADEVWGGPNHGYSLAQARRNFREFLVMYEPEHDRRIGAPDSESERTAKRALMAAFSRLDEALPRERPGLLSDIHKLERQLASEVKRKIELHEAVQRSSAL